MSTLGPIIIAWWPGVCPHHQMSVATGHWLPLSLPRPGLSILTSLPRDRSIRTMRGRLCLSLCKPISLCPADSGQIIPAVTFLLRTPSSKHLTSKFSWTLRSYLLMLERGKIRFISSFLSPSTTRSLTCICPVKIQACIAHFSQRIYLLNATLRFFHVKSHESDQPQ